MSLKQGFLRWLTKGTDTIVVKEKTVVVEKHHHHYYGSGTDSGTKRKFVAREDGAVTGGVKSLERFL